MTELNTKRFQYDILLVSPFNWGPLLFKWPVYHSTQSSRSHLTPTILFSRESIKAESEVTQSKEAHWAKLFNRFGTFLNTLPKKIDSIFAKPSCIILPAVTHSIKRTTDSVHNFWSSNKCSREQRTQLFLKKNSYLQWIGACLTPWNSGPGAEIPTRFPREHLCVGVHQIGQSWH